MEAGSRLENLPLFLFLDFGGLTVVAELIVDVQDLADADLEGWDGAATADAWPRLAGHRQAWWQALQQGLRHRGFLLTVRCGERLVGALPLVLVKGPIFGRFLVSLPYVNTGGVWVGSEAVGEPGSGRGKDVGVASGGEKSLSSSGKSLSSTKKPLSLTLSPAAGERGLNGAAGARGLEDAAEARGLEEVAEALVGRACSLADELDVKYLELRHETPVEHPRLNFRKTDKVHMRLPLPATDELLDKSFKSKLRSQVRKAGQFDHHVVWGGAELLDDFYDVFAVNMRDLGTPVFSKQLFAEVLQAFGGDAELCVVYQPAEKPLSVTPKPLSPAAGERGLSGTARPSLTLDALGVKGKDAGARVKGLRAVAGALLVHADGVTEVPSASCLRSANPTGANMWMYRHLLRHAIERGSHTFDFGRSSAGSGTYKFKAQWGAQPHPAVWQYYVRKGSVEAMRPDAAGNQRLIRVWQKLPVWLTRCIGPEIVRGIP